ncbi:MAG: secretin N-terminal domain-containing protein, partial [Verrucomicrobiota bacterium]
MAKVTPSLACGITALFAMATVSFGQTATPTPGSTSNSMADLQTPALGASTKTTTKTDAALVQASTISPSPAGITPSSVPATATTTTTTTPATATTTNAGTTSSATVAPAAVDEAAENGGVGVREFQGDDVGQVLRLLARQAKINMVVSDQLPPNSTVTMRLEDVTALQAVAIIVKAKGLFMDKIDNVYYVKTDAERAKEPTESDSYQFSYSRAKDIAPLIASQLASKDPPQVDERTNMVFFRETRSNIDNVRKLLANVDKPTKQVMIEARLVEVTANPKQSFGINWAGV